MLISLIFALVYYAINYPLKYKNQINKYALQYNLSSALVASVINTESSFDKNATSIKGACGLMQIMPTTGQYIAENLGQTFNIDNLYNPDTNIQYGCYYLNYLFDKFKDQRVVLASYNAGEGVVSNWLKDSRYSQDGVTLQHIPYQQTRQYVDKVNQNINIYKNKLKES